MADVGGGSDEEIGNGHVHTASDDEFDDDNDGVNYQDAENGMRHRTPGDDTVRVPLDAAWGQGPSLLVAGQVDPGKHRGKRHKRRGPALWVTCVMLVVRALHAVRLVPKYWLDSGGESGHSEPHAIVWIRSGGLARRLLPLALACIIVGGMLYAIVSFATSSPDTIVVNGHTVANPYSPANPAVVDFGSGRARQWMSQRPAGFYSTSDIAEGFFTAPIYSTRRDMNVTVQWLRAMLARVCKSTECDCISAAEVGVWASAVYTDGELMLQPNVIARDDDKRTVVFEDGVERQLPVAASFEYRCTTGQHDRKTLEGNANFCVLHAISVLSERGKT